MIHYITQCVLSQDIRFVQIWNNHLEISDGWLTEKSGTGNVLFQYVNVIFLLDFRWMYFSFLSHNGLEHDQNIDVEYSNSLIFLVVCGYVVLLFIRKHQAFTATHF